MSYTHKTINYELPQWLGTDKPTFLGDLNGAFLAIDTAMKTNATDASAANTLAGTADGKADANALAIQSLDTQINTPGTGLAADVASNALAIQGVSDKVGTGTLDTTAQNCIGAINEVNAGKASNTELATGLAGKVDKTREYVRVIADGVKTMSELLNELHAQVNHDKINPFTTYLVFDGSRYNFRYEDSTIITFGLASVTTILDIAIKSASSEYKATYLSTSPMQINVDESATVPSANVVITLFY